MFLCAVIETTRGSLRELEIIIKGDKLGPKPYRLDRAFTGERSHGASFSTLFRGLPYYNTMLKFLCVDNLFQRFIVLA